MRYLVLILLAGCATDGGWVKPGTTEQDFITDRGACVAQAYAVPNPQQQAMILAGCLQGRGWRWQEK